MFGNTHAGRYHMRLITVLFGWSLALALNAAQPSDNQPLITTNEEALLLKHTNGVQLAQGASEASIAKVTSTILEKGHYLKQPFNDEISSKFLDRYFDALDNLHIYFLQSDL